MHKPSLLLHRWKIFEVVRFMSHWSLARCVLALCWSQISKIVYGASDENRGFVKMGTQLHPKTTVVSGILANEASS
jgi:tRNA(Arg) A34 adenosine deaminase TadA